MYTEVGKIAKTAFRWRRGREVFEQNTNNRQSENFREIYMGHSPEN